jgi:hypothetical protein
MSGQARATPKLLVTSTKDSPELEVLDTVKDKVQVIAIGRNVDELSHLSEDDWAGIEVLLNCGALAAPCAPCCCSML